MRINLNQLRCFYLAAKFKSVSRAAEALFVTPSAVTMQIKKLERWLGFRLLMREGNAIKLTHGAEAIYAQAEKVFREAEALEQLLEKQMRSQKGEVIIGSHHILAKYILPKFIARIKRLHPKLNVKIVLDSVPQLIDRLHANELHFVLTASLPPKSRLKTIPLFFEEMVLVALKGSRHIRRKKISAQEVASFPLLQQEHSIYIVDEYLKKTGVPPNIVMDNISADVIKQFILQDMGGAILMRFTVQDELDSGVFQEIRVAEGLPTARFSLVFLDENNFPPDLQELVSSLENSSFRRDDLV